MNMGLIYKISWDSTRLICSVKIKYPIKNRASRTNIAAPSSLEIISPTGGERWEARYIPSITWTSIGTIEDVRIEYSTNNGTNC